MIVVFKCNENMNKYEEEFEFDDTSTDDEIQAEYVEWVWQQIGDNYTWYKKE